MQYSFPEGVELSAECRDLITRMLVAGEHALLVQGWMDGRMPLQRPPVAG